MKKILLTFVSTFIISLVFSQTIIQKPFFEKTTHETLEILSITLSDKETVIEMSIRGDNGWFCADTSYYINDRDNGKKYKLIKANNVPLCPKSYKFKNDSLAFQLVFPALEKNVNYIDIIEGCDNACVKIEKILVNSKMSKIKKGYGNAKNLFSDKKYSQSLKTAIETISLITDTTCLEYGQITLLIASDYLRLKDYSNAEKWYSKILASNLSDSLETNDFMDPYANFKYKAYEGIAYVYEYKEDWENSLKYVNLAESYPYISYSPTHRLEEAVDILEWKVFLYEKMKNYDKAVYENLIFIINNFGSGVRERLYKRTNQRLVNLVDSHYERYNFKSILDSAIEKMTIIKQDSFIIASFKFMNETYKIRVFQNLKDLKTDENYRLILGSENKIKDKDYFKNRITNQLFYQRIQLMSGQVFTKNGNLLYYLDKPYTGTFYEFWINGNNRTKGELKNGIFEGDFVFYFENGNIKETGKMTDGNKSGIWKKYYDNGAIECEGEYIDGKYNGKWIFWYESGKQNVPVEINGYTLNATSDKELPKQKKAEMNFKNDLENGLVTIWYENNQIFRQGKYIDGKRDGEWKEWNEEGALVKKGKFKKGALISGDKF